MPDTDTQNQQQADTSDQQQQSNDQSQDQQQNQQQDHWASGFSEDIRNNPTVKKYATNEEQVKGHLELQSLMGHDKVMLPKDENDLVAIQTLNRALGVPDEASGYELEAPEKIPGMENMEFEMDAFKTIAHKHSLTPNQAAGIAKEYRDMLVDIKNKSEASYTEQVTQTKNALTKEWGLAYDTNIKLAQNVMNKFAGGKEAFDHINSLIGTDPVAMKMLATMGGQFSEGSLGDLGGDHGAGFTKTPADAKSEYDTIMSDKTDVYWSGTNKEAPTVPESVRLQRVAHVESLLKMMNAGNASGPQTNHVG